MKALLYIAKVQMLTLIIDFHAIGSDLMMLINDDNDDDDNEDDDDNDTESSQLAVM